MKVHTKFEIFKKNGRKWKIETKNLIVYRKFTIRRKIYSDYNAENIILRRKHKMQKINVWIDHWSEIMACEDAIKLRYRFRLMELYGTKEFYRFINRICIAMRVPKAWMAQIRYDLSHWTYAMIFRYYEE